MTFKIMSVDELKARLQDSQVQVIDIRDQQAFHAEHIENAQHIGEHNMDAFLLEADMDKVLVVCCYSGMMSQNAAQYFFEQGFCEVYSLQGGYLAWQASDK